MIPILKANQHCPHRSTTMVLNPNRTPIMNPEASMSRRCVRAVANAKRI